MGRVAAAVLVLLAAGCSQLPAMHWPWHHRPAPAAAPVHELDISGAAGAPSSFPQYWKRNTLLVDLTGASGSGSITLKPADGAAWPPRLALRVTPGAFGLLEVRADQRLSLPITPAAGKPIDLELAPRMYTSKTRQMTVAWGPDSSPAP
ncbi:MAG TPA: hypothetical protein VGD47_09520 [Steroidobacteraceae bacterium]